MTKYYDSKNKWRKEETPISISDEWTRDPNPSYYCDYCQRRLSKLQNNTGNVSYYCVACSIEVDPSLTELRSKSKISMSEGPTTTPLASTKFIEPDLRRKKTEIKGGLAEIAKKGSIRVTSYTE